MCFDGNNTTSRILDILEEERPKVICIDELEKKSRQFQNQLLDFIESGRIKVDQMRRKSKSPEKNRCYSVGDDHDHSYDFSPPAVCNAEVCVWDTRIVRPVERHHLGRT